MAPIPVYSSSPINAAKPSGATPETAEQAESDAGGKSQPATSAPAAQAYPSAQTGAIPSLPRQTPMPQTANVGATRPTQTSGLADSPPAPQPGAVPVPLGPQPSSGSLPPPPKAGASIPVTGLPPQMAYQPPQAPLPVQGRSSTATAVPSAVQANPTSTLGNASSTGYSPAAGGYQQDSYAAGYGHNQGPAAAYEDQSDTSVWDTAKKWAASAGESLAAAENEVWKRINKD